MSGDMQAALITKILGIGTSKDDEMGYVDCELNHKDRHAIAFLPYDASQVVVAFIAAAGHLEKKQAMKLGKPRDGFQASCTPTVGVEIAADNLTDGKHEIIFRMVLSSGAALNFAVPKNRIPAVIAALTTAMGTATDLPQSKPN